jgi:DNA replication and repair protein RecF
MPVTRIGLRSFRSYDRAELQLGGAVTVITGENGAGKTNLLEALYFGCTGRSCRTTNERDVVKFGAEATRVTVDVELMGATHELAVGFAPGQPKHLAVDGSSVDRLLDHEARPLLSVFLPDRLELIKGAPGLRRAHIDQVVAGLWPARAETRREYGRALAQRNALLLRIRDGRSAESTLDAWDAELAAAAAALVADRTEAVALVAPRVPELAAELGLPEVINVRYRSVASELTVDEIAGWLAGRRESDLARGFTQSGPHRDDLVICHGGRELRTFGSQGQQRAALLALLLAERDVLASVRDQAPIMLLDDVLSELDADRRARLIDRVSSGGQAVVTATELDHLPEAVRGNVAHVEVMDGVLHHRSEVAA